MKCDQVLCLNLRYEFKKLLWQDELNPWFRCAFGNAFTQPGVVMESENDDNIQCSTCQYLLQSFHLEL